MFNFRLFSAFSVVISAQSAPGNVKERAEVRSTWGQNCNAQTWCRLVFVIGNFQNDTIQDQILSKFSMSRYYQQNFPRKMTLRLF